MSPRWLQPEYKIVHAMQIVITGTATQARFGIAWIENAICGSVNGEIATMFAGQSETRTDEGTASVTATRIVTCESVFFVRCCASKV